MISRISSTNCARRNPTTNNMDARWMALALSLGQRGLGQVWPNPSVGCVIVKDGRVVGRGHTQAGGRPHGEVMALQQAGAQARGATAYVTLEPCAHTGKSPPCTSALIKAGVARVVSAIEDPDPRVSGKGHALLQQAGIKITTGILADQARQAHIGFLTRVTRNRPAITLKLAASLDGRIATSTGDSRWITGPQSRRYTHLLRADHDAIMVGVGTVLADDPDLSVRIPGLENRSPLRVVMDTQLRTPVASRLVKTAAQKPLFLCHGPHADTAAFTKTDATLIACDLQNNHLSLADALAQLAAQGLTRIFCEGGGQLAASLLRLGFVDRLITFNAGVAIGGDGRAQIAGFGIEQLADAPRFTLCESRRIGPDIVNHWQPA